MLIVFPPSQFLNSYNMINDFNAVVHLFQELMQSSAKFQFFHFLETSLLLSVAHTVATCMVTL